MAMIKCKECGKDISSLAEKCPHCGAPTNPGAEALKTVGSAMQERGSGCSSIATVLIVVGIIIILAVVFISK